MEIKHSVNEYLLSIRLVDMRCKHALSTSDKGREVIRLSSLIGYASAEWGFHSNHLDIRYHADVIMKMEKDGYTHAQRVVICNYDFCKEPCIWLDNMHSAVLAVRRHGMNVRLKDIPFYVVDISGNEPVVSENDTGVLDMELKHIEGAVDCAYKRHEWSNSEQLVNLNYRLGEFLSDNPVLLTCREYFGTDGAVRGPKCRI